MYTFAKVVLTACLIHKALVSLSREDNVAVCCYMAIDLLLFNLSFHLSYITNRPESLGFHSKTWTMLHILEPKIWDCFSFGFGSDHYLHKHWPLNPTLNFPQGSRVCQRGATLVHKAWKNKVRGRCLEAMSSSRDQGAVEQCKLGRDWQALTWVRVSGARWGGCESCNRKGRIWERGNGTWLLSIPSTEDNCGFITILRGAFCPFLPPPHAQSSRWGDALAEREERRNNHSFVTTFLSEDYQVPSYLRNLILLDKITPKM